jgi:uncharacterized protein YjbI with pentapeptide repeats
MTAEAFFEALSNGQRHFSNLDFEYLDGFQNKDYSDCVFENCFLYLDFEGSNFTNAEFIFCNLKEIRLVNCNLTNAMMKNCLVESAEFTGSKTDGFVFRENYYFGMTLDQKDFEKILQK